MTDYRGKCPNCQSRTDFVEDNRFGNLVCADCQYMPRYSFRKRIREAAGEDIEDDSPPDSSGEGDGGARP